MRWLALLIVMAPLAGAAQAPGTHPLEYYVLTADQLRMIELVIQARDQTIADQAAEIERIKAECRPRGI